MHIETLSYESYLEFLNWSLYFKFPTTLSENALNSMQKSARKLCKVSITLEEYSTTKSSQ